MTDGQVRHQRATAVDRRTRRVGRKWGVKKYDSHVIPRKGF